MEYDASVWINLLRDVGFPILLAVYLLLRFEKRIHKLSETIKELNQTIQCRERKNNNENIQKTMDRYNQIVQTYSFLSNTIDVCASEDKAFYQDVCVLFAKKKKKIQSELMEQGLVFTKEIKIPSFCNEK